MAVNKIITVTIAAATLSMFMSGCTDSPSGQQTERVRAPQEPILGVVSTPGKTPPECVSSVVKRKENVPSAEFIISGQMGDIFSYQVTQKNDSTITGKSNEFQPGQQSVVFTTGVDNADIKLVTISATGKVGMPDQCVITTIQ